MFSRITCPYSYHNIYATLRLLLACLSLSPLENNLPRDKTLGVLHRCFPSTQCSICHTRETEYILLLNWVKCSLLPRVPASESSFPRLLCYLLHDPEPKKSQNRVLLFSSQKSSWRHQFMVMFLFLRNPQNLLLKECWHLIILILFMWLFSPPQ